jgi:hypothetical protein
MGGGYRNQSKRLVRRPTWLARALRSTSARHASSYSVTITSSAPMTAAVTAGSPRPPLSSSTLAVAGCSLVSPCASSLFLYTMPTACNMPSARAPSL